jgi:hypothetical protein
MIPARHTKRLAESIDVAELYRRELLAIERVATSGFRLKIWLLPMEAYIDPCISMIL